MSPLPAPSLTTADPLPLSARALRHQITAYLLREIFSGRLGHGSRLVVQQLSTRFGVSSTPVREALVELESVGVVEISHNRGAVVKPFGAAQMREIYQLRRILEAEAVRAAWGQIDRELLLQARNEMQSLADDHDESLRWSTLAMQADRRLHALIAARCGSERLASEIERYNTLVQSGRDLVGNQRQAQETAVKAHLAVLDTLLYGSPDEAARQMARHIDETADHVVAVMFGPPEPAFQRDANARATDGS